MPDGKQLNVTLSGLPADYDLYVQRAGMTLATSRTAGHGRRDHRACPTTRARPTTPSSSLAAAPVNNPAPYTLNVSLSAAPPQPSFTNAECLAVDPERRRGYTGNHQPEPGHAA